MVIFHINHHFPKVFPWFSQGFRCKTSPQKTRPFPLCEALRLCARSWHSELHSPPSDGGWGKAKKKTVVNNYIHVTCIYNIIYIVIIYHISDIKYHISYVYIYDIYNMFIFIYIYISLYIYIIIYISYINIYTYTKSNPLTKTQLHQQTVF